MEKGQLRTVRGGGREERFKGTIMRDYGIDRLLDPVKITG